jgi:hypothetical protein
MMATFDPPAGMALSEPVKAVARKQLTQLAAQNDQPALRDLARDVLAGKVDLRGAVLGNRYTDLLDEGTRQYSNWYRNLSDEERAEQARQGETLAAEAHHELIAEQRPTRRPRRPAATDDDDLVQRPILKKRRPR